MLVQLIIGIAGVLSLWLTQQKNAARRKYACIVGLFAQPFWAYSAWEAQQWGILFLALVYAIIWGIGLKNYWLFDNANKQV